jgi:hypothetical protein
VNAGWLQVPARYHLDPGTLPENASIRVNKVEAAGM